MNRAPFRSLLIVVSMFLLLTMQSRLHAQINRNIDTLPPLWELDYRPQGTLDDVVLDSLVGSMLFVTYNGHPIPIPVDSLVELRRANRGGPAIYGVVGTLLGALLGAFMEDPTLKSNCGHPCIPIPGWGFSIGALFGLSSGLYIEANLIAGNRYTFTGVPYAERMQILSGMVGKFP